MKLPSTHKLIIKKRIVRPKDWPSVDLREELKVALTQEASEKSYSLLRSREKKYVFSEAAFIIGGVGLVVAALGLILTGAMIVSSFGFSEDTADVIEKPAFAIPPFTGLTIAMFGIFAVTLASGFALRRRLSTEAFNPLSSNGENIFQTVEMREKWNAFLDWFKDSKAEMGVKEKGGTISLFTPELISFENLEIFIVGDSRHRDLLLQDASVNSSPLVIHKRDWANFERFHNCNSRIRVSHSGEPKTHKSTVKKNSSKSNSDLSLIQRARGKYTRICPRLNMITKNDSFFKKARMQMLQLTTQDINHKPCYEALMVLETNFDDLHIFFANSKKRKGFGPNQNNILDRLNKDIGKAVNAHENPSRLSHLQARRWPTMERYLETLDVISDDEVLEKYPELLPFK